MSNLNPLFEKIVKPFAPPETFFCVICEDRKLIKELSSHPGYTGDVCNECLDLKADNLHEYMKDR